MHAPARPFAYGFTALALVLAHSSLARADECAIDTDCGPGFSCESSVGAGSGGAASSSGGAASSSGGAASGGSPSATGGSAGTPAAMSTCGDGFCQTLNESPESCPADCGTYRYCAPAACDSGADCAEGYVCVASPHVGTGGGGFGGTGSDAMTFCGDGVCLSPEDESSCPSDCALWGHCQPQAGNCYSDSECAAGYYCDFGVMTGGAGGSPSAAGGDAGAFATGGSGGEMGGAGGSGALGGTTASGGTTGGIAGSAPAGGSSGSAGKSSVALPGTCMPSEGTGGVTGTGGIGTGMGGTDAGTSGVATGGSAGSVGSGSGGVIDCPGGGCGPAGTSGGETSAGGTRASGAGGSSGTTSTGGTTPPANDAGAPQGHDVVTHGGCSVSERGESPSSGALGAFGALALAWIGRRRRRSAE